MKIKYKIAAIFSVICTALIGLTGLFLYYFFSENLEKQFRERLLERAIIAAEVLLEKDEFDPGKYRLITARYLQTLPEEKVFYLRTSNGQIDYENIPERFINIPAIEKALTERYNFYSTGNLQVCSLYYEDNQGDYVILLAARNDEGANQLHYLKNILLIIILIGIILTVAVSLLFAGSILKPLKSMVGRMEEISSSNLQLRLQEGEGKDEISRLAKTFNGMLGRLERSFSTQENFIHNASHELRTPLTVILGEAEYALNNTNPDAQTRIALEKIYLQADHLRQLLTSLLQLSEIKNDLPRSGFKILRIDELMQQVIIKLNESITNGKIQMEYQNVHSLSAGSFEINGNYLWLEIAFTNLLNNALKYSDPKPVKISISHTEQKVLVQIEDKGIGIPKDEMEKIFNPFYRGKNSTNREGYGIGLSLTQNIIRIHKGKIHLKSSEGKGSTILIELPKEHEF